MKDLGSIKGRKLNKLIPGDCSLCRVLVDNDNRPGDNNFYDTLLYKYHEYNLIPSIGPLSLGHIMIVSDQHFKNLSMMGSASLKSYEALIGLVKKNISTYTNDLLEAEHGAYEDTGAGACIIHTHIHLMPGFGKYESAFISDLDLIMKTNKIQDLEGIDQPYIMVRGNSGLFHIFDGTNVPSQYIRRRLCEITERTDWDWGVYPDDAGIQGTIELWKDQI